MTRKAGLAVAGCLLLSACTGSGHAKPSATPRGSCRGTTLSVHVTELTTSARPATAVLAAPPTPQTVGLWIGDYPHPDLPGSFDQSRGAPAGHARVLLTLVSLGRAPLGGGVTAPAAASGGAAFRATLVIQTHDRVHGAYVNVRGKATLTIDRPGLACGSFDIGDADERAQGTFQVAS